MLIRAHAACYRLRHHVLTPEDANQNERNRAAAEGRAVRHLPGRPVPPDGRLRRGEADRGVGLRCRGAGGPDLLRPAGLQFRRPEGHPRHRQAGDRRFRALRLRRRAVGLLRRHAEASLCRAVRRRCRTGDAARRPSAPRSTNWSASSTTCAACGTSTARFDGTVTYHDCLLGPARARRPQPAAPAAQLGRRPEADRAAGRRRLLRLRRHVLRQVSRHLERHRREEDRGDRATGRRRCSPAISAA